MRKGITVQMTTNLMITYLGTYPIYEQTKENKQDATDLCNKVLDLAMETKDESKQTGMISVVYLAAELMELIEILDTAIIKELFTESIRLQPEETELIREMAMMDYKHYLDWIFPFLSKAGVDDIDSELRDLDNIQDAIQGLPR